LKVTPSATLPRQKRLEGFRGWLETLLTKNSRGWYVKDLSPDLGLLATSSRCTSKVNELVEWRLQVLAL
jgi:hypothetical protein